MIMMTVIFESGLTKEEVYKVAEERLPMFLDVPGLMQKYYLKKAEPNHYSGVYIWDSLESMKAYRESELAATIPLAYKIQGQPQIQVDQVFTQLRK
jgi:heme-degrading monooxygenase HmoA